MKSLKVLFFIGQFFLTVSYVSAENTHSKANFTIATGSFVYSVAAIVGINKDFNECKTATGLIVDAAKAYLSTRRFSTQKETLLFSRINLNFAWSDFKSSTYKLVTRCGLIVLAQGLLVKALNNIRNDYCNNK